MNDPVAELRPLLFSIAYRMLGSASDAEDIVQEAFLRFHRETGAGTERQLRQHGLRPSADVTAGRREARSARQAGTNEIPIGL